MKTIRPEFKIKIDIRPPFIDERGEILNLIDAPFASAAVIRSVKGAIRGNHYHKTDYHYCWLQSGGMVYYHRPVGGSGPIEKRVISAGELFYTPALYEHVMYFTEDSVLFVFARNNRDMPHYEADTVRVPPFAKIEEQHAPSKSPRRVTRPGGTPTTQAAGDGG